MKDKFGLKELVQLTVLYLVFEGFDLAITGHTGIHWISPRDFLDYLGLIAIGLLWVWYFVDKFRRK